MIRGIGKLATLLLLSMLAAVSVVAVITPAAAVEGDWITLRQANDYHEVDPETGEEPPYQAAPGYTYTDEGFTTIPADYTGTCPYFNIRSKDKYDIRDGLYIQLRVDDFSSALGELRLDPGGSGGNGRGTP